MIDCNLNFEDLKDIIEHEKLELGYLDKDHFILRDPNNGTEKLYCCLQGNCAEQNKCIQQIYLD